MKRGMTRWYWAEAASPRWSSMRKSCLNHTIATSLSCSNIAAAWAVAGSCCSSPKNAFEGDGNDDDESQEVEEEGEGEGEMAPFPHSRCMRHGAFILVPVAVEFIVSCCCHGFDGPPELACINSHATAVPSPDFAKMPLTPTKLSDKLTLGGLESSGGNQEACNGRGLHTRSEAIPWDSCKKFLTNQYSKLQKLLLPPIKVHLNPHPQNDVTKSLSLSLRSTFDEPKKGLCTHYCELLSPSFNTT